LIIRVSRPVLATGILGLGIGYFAWYTPYAALTKALSSGLLPGMDESVGGLVLLPAAAFGTLIGSVLFLAISGWWRYAGRREVLGRSVPWPGRATLTAGAFMAVVIATTTLNYTFAGVSILFMLLMMRAGVLILSPLVDTARRRRVRAYSWVALALSMLAVVTALSDIDSYRLTLGAVLSLAAYLTGYVGRFQIMSRVAKTGDPAVDRRYLVEEQMSAVVWQIVLCGLLALIGIGPVTAAIREGFTTFLLTSAVLPALAVGLLYQALFVYGTLIYLDPREYTWCVPVNRCASLFSGLVASYGLTWLTGIAAPGSGQLIATGFVVLAVAALCYPVWQPALARQVGLGQQPASRRLLFVCGGNTARSPMAEAFARAELARAKARGWAAGSAGVSAHSPGAPMAEAAVATLHRLGVPVHSHRSRQLTPELCRDSVAVYCMTSEQRQAAMTLAPDAGDRIFCLDPTGDIPEPTGADAVLECAQRIRRHVQARIAEQLSGVLTRPQVQPQGGV